jgi:ketosteroid isomerase-like protein
MKNVIVKYLFLFYLISVLVACNTKNNVQLSAEDIEKIKKEIQAKEDEFAAVYNAGEMKSIGYYADDAVTFYQNTQPLVGKPAIIEYLKENLDSLAKSHKISFKTNEVFVADNGNQVGEIGYYKVVDSDNNPVNTGNYMALFVKRDGKYVSLRDMSASDMPVE